MRSCLSCLKPFTVHKIKNRIFRKAKFDPTYVCSLSLSIVSQSTISLSLLFFLPLTSCLGNKFLPILLRSDWILLSPLFSAPAGRIHQFLFGDPAMPCTARTSFVISMLHWNLLLVSLLHVKMVNSLRAESMYFLFLCLHYPSTGPRI